MTLDSSLAKEAHTPSDSFSPQSERPEQILDDLIHGKSKILGRKLDILAAEMRWRLHMAATNLKRIDQDQEQLAATMQRLERQALYGLRDDGRSEGATVPPWCWRMCSRYSSSKLACRSWLPVPSAMPS